MVLSFCHHFCLPQCSFECPSVYSFESSFQYSFQYSFESPYGPFTHRINGRYSRSRAVQSIHTTNHKHTKATAYHTNHSDGARHGQRDGAGWSHASACDTARVLRAVLYQTLASMLCCRHRLLVCSLCKAAYAGMLRAAAPLVAARASAAGPLDAVAVGVGGCHRDHQ